MICTITKITITVNSAAIALTRLTRTAITILTAALPTTTSAACTISSQWPRIIITTPFCPDSAATNSTISLPLACTALPTAPLDYSTAATSATSSNPRIITSTSCTSFKTKAATVSVSRLARRPTII